LAKPLATAGKPNERKREKEEEEEERAREKVETRRGDSA
jgi:hypothetical protein